MLGLHGDFNRIDCLHLPSLTGVMASYMHTLHEKEPSIPSLIQNHLAAH
jgi:hypothetical protein